MTELDPNARALVEAGRRALRGSDADRARIEAALRARLGPDALPADGGVTQVATTSWQAVAVAGAAIGIFALAGVAFYALRPTADGAAPEARPAAPLPTSQTPAAPPPAPTAEPEPTAPAHTGVAPAPLPPPAASTSRSPDGLAREVALLSRATSELRAGRAAAAMKVLVEHQRRFPSGALSQERRSARAQALCLMGRVDQGRAELARLTPQSPAAATAQQVCDGAVPGAAGRK
jgi:type IV secretory pathway VirB10-like protein